MWQTLLLRNLARHAPGVALARVRRGPGRPSWSFRFELFTTALRQTTRVFAGESWPQLRAGYDSLANPRSRVFARVTREATDGFGVPSTWFTPREAADGGAPATVLYLHGGAYIFGSVRSHGELVARLAVASRARILAPEYRLAPEHPFPAAIDDVEAVYRALLETGTDPARLVVAGDSAGGGLTVALLLRLRAKGVALPAGAALLCPWVDLTARGGSLATNASYDWTSEADGRRWIAAYLAGRDPTDPLASPVYADLEGLPPLLVQVGSAELLHDQVTRFVDRAKSHAVDARLVVEPDMVHNWQTLAGIFPDCARALDQIGLFVRERTPGGRTRSVKTGGKTRARTPATS